MPQAQRTDKMSEILLPKPTSIHRVVIAGLQINTGITFLRRHPDDKIEPGRLNSPCGHIEDGERALGTLLRELSEETGISLHGKLAIPEGGLRYHQSANSTDGVTITSLGAFRATMSLSIRGKDGMETPVTSLIYGVMFVVQAPGISIGEIRISQEHTEAIALSASLLPTVMNQVTALDRYYFERNAPAFSALGIK